MFRVVFSFLLLEELMAAVLDAKLDRHASLNRWSCLVADADALALLLYGDDVDLGYFAERFDVCPAAGYGLKSTDLYRATIVRPPHDSHRQLSGQSRFNSLGQNPTELLDNVKVAFELDSGFTWPLMAGNSSEA